ncbi:unnamed protein product [Danaus chrysippus]|uniref:(African queen) hypothetical protein n=1 Tax=Danaus chrysippus TaxID=151541 RepID=A0A8J2VR07_9NEOP|nr:unnamed protein product [Danaus chrysippus]
MYYIIVTESESPGETSCKIKGLTNAEVDILESYCKERQVTYLNLKEFFEADIQGVQVLNIICGVLGYQILTQSMAIEDNYIGGRKIKVQKLVWMMYK